MDMKADEELVDEEWAKRIIDYIARRLGGLGWILRPLQLPPTLSKASVFHLDLDNFQRILHSTVMPDDIDHQGQNLFYRRLREHWFLKNNVNWSSVLNGNDDGKLVAKVELGSYPTLGNYESDSTFQFRCKPILSSTDWQAGSPPSINGGNTLAFEIDDPNRPSGKKTVSHVAFELASANNVWSLKNLVWFSDTKTPHPLFDGDPATNTKPVKLSRKPYSSISADFFFDEHITSP